MIADYGIPPREVDLMTLHDVADINEWEAGNPSLRSLLIAGFQLKISTPTTAVEPDYEAFYTQIQRGTLNGMG